MHEDGLNDETGQDPADVHAGSEVGEAGSSQSTEVQSMIVGSLSNVCQRSLTCDCVHGHLMLQQQKQRHNINKQKVKDSYNGTKINLQNSIAGFFDSQEDHA